MSFKHWFLFLFLCGFMAQAQKTQDFTADYIKTAAFMNGEISTIPFFPLNESFTLEFDDLYGDESNYYYRVLAYNYDWTPSQLRTIEYIRGMENQRIKNVENSFNTLQMYTHYRLSIPNNVYTITKSGNYILEIYNEDNEVVIRRKFILYENNINVGAQVKRMRDLAYIDTKQTLNITVKLGEQIFENPLTNVKIALFQNARWDSYISKIKPQYTIGADLIYNYDAETSFWAGNQYRYFDNSDLRQANNMIFKNLKENGMYRTDLYPIIGRANKGYTYFPDINGAFKIRNIYGQNPSIDSEYSWVYFTFEPDTPANNKIDYYITGAFNNYELIPDNRLDFNTTNNNYEKALLVKQGFTNYNVISVVNGKIDPKLQPDGNYALTTNKYQILVYYRGSTDQYDRVIGFTEADAAQIAY